MESQNKKLTPKELKIKMQKKAAEKQKQINSKKEILK